MNLESFKKENNYQENECPSNTDLQEYFEGYKGNINLEKHIQICNKCKVYLKKLTLIDQQIKNYYQPSLLDKPTQTQIENTMNKIKQLSNINSRPIIQSFINNIFTISHSYKLYGSIAIILAFAILIFSLFYLNKDSYFEMYKPKFNQNNSTENYTTNFITHSDINSYNKLNSSQFLILLDKSTLNKDILSKSTQHKLSLHKYSNKYMLHEEVKYNLEELIIPNAEAKFELFRNNQFLAKFTANQKAEFSYCKNKLSITNGVFEFEFKIPNSSFVVKTPHCELFNIGTIYRLTVKNSYTEVSVLKGQVKVVNVLKMPSEYLLEAGQQIYIDQSQIKISIIEHYPYSTHYKLVNDETVSSHSLLPKSSLEKYIKVDNINLLNNQNYNIKKVTPKEDMNTIQKISSFHHSNDQISSSDSYIANESKSFIEPSISSTSESLHESY